MAKGKLHYIVFVDKDVKWFKTKYKALSYIKEIWSKVNCWSTVQGYRVRVKTNKTFSVKLTTKFFR
jgi:hypothetical protein